MRILHGGRGSGKTVQLIKDAAEYGMLIVCPTALRAKDLKRHIRAMFDAGQIDMLPPDPVSLAQLQKSSPTKFDVAFDDVEFIFKNLLGVVPSCISVTASVSDVVEVDWRKPVAIPFLAPYAPVYTKPDPAQDQVTYSSLYEMVPINKRVIVPVVEET